MSDISILLDASMQDLFSPYLIHHGSHQRHDTYIPMPSEWITSDTKTPSWRIIQPSVSHPTQQSISTSSRSRLHTLTAKTPNSPFLPNLNPTSSFHLAPYLAVSSLSAQLPTLPKIPQPPN